MTSLEERFRLRGKVAAVDGVMVGPYDISGSLGLRGQLQHPSVQRAGVRVVQTCARRAHAA